MQLKLPQGVDFSRLSAAKVAKLINKVVESGKMW